MESEDYMFSGYGVAEIAHLPLKGELHVLIRVFLLGKRSPVLQTLHFTTCRANLDIVAQSFLS